MSSNSLRININRNLNDNSWDYDFLFKLLHDYKAVVNEEIRFDFTGCRFLQQNAVSFLGGFIRLLQQNSNTIYFNLNSIIEPIRVNLEQNGFLYELGLGGSRWDGNSIPYREDFRQAGDYSDYLSERWLGQGWVNIQQDLKDHIVSHVIEAYVNVFDHANSPVGVISCGQRYPNKQELKIALVDFGVGIPHTVREYVKEPDMSSNQALRWAFEPQKTTKDAGSFARGNGLKLLKSFMQDNDGKLEIY